MDVVGVLGLLVGLISILIAIVLARKGRQKPDVRHMLDLETIVSPEDGLLNRGLSMSFAERSIGKLSKTTVALWNEHGNTVRGTDIVAEDPLCVTLADGDTLLQARVITRSRAQNKVNVETDSTDTSRMLINFDFLDEGDGAVIEILHEGTEQEPRLSGTIRGATLRRAGFTRLSPDVLEAAAIKSRITRFSRYVWNRSPGGVRPLLLLALSLAVIEFSFTGFFMFDIFREPHLADVQQYPLNTLEGQRLFSDEVNRLNPIVSSTRIPLTISIGALICIQATVMIYLFYRMTRTEIPPSIIAISERQEAEAVVADDGLAEDHAFLRSSAKLSNTREVGLASKGDTARR